MNSKKQQPLKSEKTLAEIFKYEVADGVSEYHLMIHAIQPESTYEEQLNAIIDTTNYGKKNCKGPSPFSNDTF